MSEQKTKASDVITYLNQTPEFFIQYPDLLTGLKVLNNKGELTNLVNHQVNVLQEKNRELNHKLNTLIQNAKNSEQLMDKIFQLLSQLSVEHNKNNYINAYVNFIVDNFPSDYFKLLLTNESLVSEPYMGHYSHSLVTFFEQFSKDEKPISGRLRKEKINAIFTDNDDIKSSIVLPVGKHAEFGIMVFASRDEDKFHPHMSSDILEKLTTILASFLQASEPKNENQAVS